MAAAAAIAVASAPAASAAPLPSGEKIVPAPAGWSVKLKSTGNSYSIQGSLATAQSRSAWFSTHGSVEVKVPAEAKKVEGKLGVGLIVGCQFPGQIGGEVGVAGPGAALDGKGPSVSFGGVKGGIGIPLTPGSTSSVSGFGRADALGSSDSIKFKKSGTYNVAIKDQNIDLKHCSGYAQARVVTWVEIKGGDRIQGFLYGAPFSLG